MFEFETVKALKAGTRLLRLANNMPELDGFLRHECSEDCTREDENGVKFCVERLKASQTISKWFDSIREIGSVKITKTTATVEEKFRSDQTVTINGHRSRKLRVSGVDPYEAIRFEITLGRANCEHVTVWKTVPKPYDLQSAYGQELYEDILEPSKFQIPDAILERAKAIYLDESLKRGMPLIEPEPEELEETGHMERARQEILAEDKITCTQIITN